MAEILVNPQVPSDLQAKRRKQKFLRGPVDWAWLTAAARLPGRALHLALVISYLDGFEKTGTVKLRPSVQRELGIDRHASYRALKLLEKAELISVKRGKGKAATVTIRSSTQA
jgi:hypothetical protein